MTSADNCPPLRLQDLDVFVDSAPENAERVHRALQAFGAPIAGLTVRELCEPDIVFQIGVAPNRIDILTGIDGVSFEQAWAGKIETQYGDQRIGAIGRSDLIANKRASGRPQDIVDADLLEADPAE